MVTATVTGMTRPAMSDEVQSRRKRKRMMQARIEADEDGVAHAGDAVADQFATDRRRARGCTPAGSFWRRCCDLGGDCIGDRDGVAGGLARDVEQHRGLCRWP